MEMPSAARLAKAARKIDTLLTNRQRLLNKLEIQRLLDVDDVEFELLIANDILQPSLSIEYHSGAFLGFFTYWDCLAAAVSACLISTLRDFEAVAELTNALMPELSDLFTLSPSEHADESITAETVRAVLTSHYAPIPRIRLGAGDEGLVHEVSVVALAVERAFGRLAFEEIPHDIAPYTIHLDLRVTSTEFISDHFEMPALKSHPYT